MGAKMPLNWKALIYLSLAGGFLVTAIQYYTILASVAMSLVYFAIEAFIEKVGRD